MRKLAGIQGSHPARSDGRKEVQEARRSHQALTIEPMACITSALARAQIAAADDRDE